MKIELSEDKRLQAEKHIYELLKLFDTDSDREGLKDTPRRYIKFLTEFFSPEDFRFTTFRNEGHNEMIVVSGIPFFSMCEHHLAPFFGKGAIAYIPNEKIVGLSKLPRTLEKFSRRPQNQERITTQVAEYINKELCPKG